MMNECKHDGDWVVDQYTVGGSSILSCEKCGMRLSFGNHQILVELRLLRKEIKELRNETLSIRLPRN